MRVLVVPEDQQHDQFIVKPVIERVFEELGVPARVRVLPEPRLRGSDDALDEGLLAQIIAANEAMIDQFLLVIDRDCDRRSHSTRVASLEARFGSLLVGCLAIEEIETWMLALHRQAVEHRHKVVWKEIRAHCDPKEAFAEPLLQSLGSSGPGNGRKAAMRSIGGMWKTLCSLCPEISDLRDRLGAKLKGSSGRPRA
jgi:hypothetical protein